MHALGWSNRRTRDDRRNFEPFFTTKPAVWECLRITPVCIHYP